MISQVVVVLWLVFALAVVLWGLISGKCCTATRACWKPAAPAEPCDKVAEALESRNLEHMLLALDRRCPPEQRSKLLKAILEEAQKRQDESPQMKKLCKAIAHQCEKEAPLLAEHGLEDILAELPHAAPESTPDTADLAHTHQA